MSALSLLGDDAYGVTIRQEIEKRRRPSRRDRCRLRHPVAAGRQGIRRLPRLRSAPGARRPVAQTCAADPRGRSGASGFDGHAHQDDSGPVRVCREWWQAMKPPTVAQWLLRLAAPRADREFLLADAAEEFERIAIESGRRDGGPLVLGSGADVDASTRPRARRAAIATCAIGTNLCKRRPR